MTATLQAERIVGTNVPQIDAIWWQADRQLRGIWWQADRELQTVPWLAPLDDRAALLDLDRALEPLSRYMTDLN